MAVYFLETDAVPLIKIGYTSNEARRRLMACQVGSPVPLFMAAVYEPGDKLTDLELRWRLRASHNHGDWFRVTDELLGIVRAVRETECLLGAWHAPALQDTRYSGLQFGMSFKALADRYKFDLRNARRACRHGIYESRGIELHAMPRIISYLRSLGHKITHRDLFDHTNATIWTDPPGHYEQLVRALGHITPASDALASVTQAHLLT